ncbi:MAG: sigma 54-interacting transcriptional regulator [Acidobacteriota bacterium]
MRNDPPEMCPHFYAILDAAQNGILAVDNAGRVIVANHVVEELLGLPKAELLGRDITDVIPDSLLPRILETKKPLLGQMFACNNAVLMANYSPIMAGEEVAGAVSVFQDVSILEHTSCELNYVSDHIKELGAIINASYDGIFITDGNGVVLRLNEAYQRMTGIRPEEVIGKSMRQLVSENYYDQSVTLLVMETRKPATLTQAIKGEGRFLVSGSPVFDDAGNLFRVVTSVRDVTQLLKLQDQLIKTKEQSRRYESEISYLRSLQIEAGDIIFRSRSMAQALVTATRVAYVDSTVLITGDSGTGKELIAKLIHKKGKGALQPFIAINCAALPEHLLEAELFGYEGGAFTGAKKEGKPGLFELAHGGTLFLDEVGDLPMVLQAKLLRALQEKKIMRLGGTKPFRVNVRIIGATHRDMLKMIERREFRRDLYYRLMVVPIHLPPLRDRRDDIPLLAMHFLEKFNRRFNYAKTLAPRTIDALVAYSWPGNVRELENCIERMLVTTVDGEISPEHLPELVRRSGFLPRRGSQLADAVAQLESHLLEEAFREHGSWHKVAAELGIDRATAYRKASRYGLAKQ